MKANAVPISDISIPFRYLICKNMLKTKNLLDNVQNLDSALSKMSLVNEYKCMLRVIYILINSNIKMPGIFELQ